MNKELTEDYLDKKLDQFADTVQKGFQQTEVRFQQLNQQLLELDQRLTSQIAELDQRLTSQIAELDQRLTSQIAELDQRLTKRIDDLTVNVDRFVTLHQKLEHELTALQAKYERLEQRLNKLEQRPV